MRKNVDRSTCLSCLCGPVESLVILRCTENNEPGMSAAVRHKLHKKIEYDNIFLIDYFLMYFLICTFQKFGVNTL